MSTRVPLPYGPKVLELFRKPLNAGPMEDADVVATAGSPACGDMIKLYLKVDPRGEKIERVTFESYGCAANIAAASILTEKVAGRGLEEAWRISWREISNELGGLPPIKYHCSILAVGALKRAIRTYFERRAGSRPAWLPSELTQEEKQALEEELMERLLRRSASAEGEKT